ncbi:predicted protein [Verticillium alfalfae VaMs.102]|uniref:Predicted protein n=1 Tax=Verticillium alfalfae (strain VaMs.102 / ATCC MYA-4576 / FGSC 10136) TaxID=526221 RepID=C9SY76_VERA1|nr:predicted protein [Verticillium alfalfae VaMs.102]EEY23741.1 predicted protein [Verticillium alfalfae VaMs.102]
MSSRDKSLLDRLNALKGGSGSSPHTNNSPISLDRSANALNVSVGIEPAKPASREDALAARLRSLRNTPERDIPPATAASSQAAPPTPTPKQASASSPLQQEQEQEQPHDVDPLLQTDDQTLEELLQDEDPEADPRWSLDLEPETARVEALLHELSKDIHLQDDKSAGGNDASEAENRDADEDTDGEEMNRDVDALLAQALDEAELDAKLSPTSYGLRDGPTENPPRETADGPQKGNAGRQTPEAAASPLSLPSVPSAITPHQDVHDGDDGEPSLSLPSPAWPPSACPRQTKTPRPPPPPTTCGLPSVPSDQPANRLRSGTGYTDDDAKKLVHRLPRGMATLRCLGCDDDGYCTRCWREMHVGPAAAFDDRTHKAVLLGRDPRPKRVALGA